MNSKKFLSDFLQLIYYLDSVKKRGHPSSKNEQIFEVVSIFLKARMPSSLTGQEQPEARIERYF